jgi:hypothetical protein
VGDVSRPLKGLIQGYDEVETRVRLVIFERYQHIPSIRRAWVEGGRLPEAIKYVDARLLATEARDLMGPPPQAWEDLPPPYGLRIDPWTVETAERRFLECAAAVGLKEPS